MKAVVWIRREGVHRTSVDPGLGQMFSEEYLLLHLILGFGGKSLRLFWNAFFYLIGRILRVKANQIKIRKANNFPNMETLH